MKKILALAALVAILAIAACGGDKEEAEARAEAGWTGGVELTVDEATALSELAADPAAFVGSSLRLEGEVVAVCQGSGCWIELADPAGNRFYVRSMDESIIFPKDCVGRKAAVQGDLIALPAAGHEGHDHDEEGGQHSHEPTYLLDVKGARLL